MGAAEQVTATLVDEATVKVFALVLVILKVVPLMEVAPPLNVPPVTPLRVTPVVTPAGSPCAATVVTVQGVPMATDAIWKTWVVVIGTVKAVGLVTVAVFPPELIPASENFPDNPNSQIVRV